jgi:beta-glucuronidase
MARLFIEHKKRKIQCLDGAWQTVKDAERRGEKLGYPKKLIGAHTTVVPSVWNTELGSLEYEGVVWYEKEFYTEGGTLRFSFGAVMTEAQVYLDGELLGKHYGGFNRFCFNKANVAAGMHTLTVRVDNTIDGQSIPMRLVDWYHYGGITRSVEVETLEGAAVLYNLVDYEIKGDSANCKFRVELYNSTDAELSDKVSISLGGEAIAQTDFNLSPYETKEIVLSGIIKGIERWSPENPRLYELKSETSSDDLYDRIGFRTIEIKDRKMLLNGEEYKIRGINRHEDHPDFGMAFPVTLMQRDLDILENMNCNSIRGSHYPNNPTFIDMLDQRGLTFWSEIPIWGNGFSLEALVDPVVIERGLQMHREMVKEYYNHPSIIIWGMHNEILSGTQAAYEMTKQYHDELRANGGNRLVTHATARPLEDICYEFDDIICINHYTGWYGGDMNNWAKVIGGHKARRDALGFADKPMIYSEFGGAALYGHHTFDDIKWTEEYQARLFAHCLELFHNTPEIVGWYIWQFTDMRTCRELGNDRARGFNNKGILNEYRKPKMAYHTVREKFRRFAEEEK